MISLCGLELETDFQSVFPLTVSSCLSCASEYWLFPFLPGDLTDLMVLGYEVQDDCHIGSCTSVSH